MSLLVVEHEANRRDGHFMKELEAVATAAASDGHTVHVLADGPLAIEEEQRTLAGIAGVHRVAPRWVRAARRGQRLSMLGRGRQWAVVVLPIRYVGHVLFQRALVRGVAACAADLGDVPTLVLSWHLGVGWAVVFAPRSARWAVYEHRVGGIPAGSGVLYRWCVRRERRRKAAGGWVHLVANSPAVDERCRERLPYVQSILCPLAGVVPRTPLDRSEARAKLGLAPDGQIALSFGASHRGKDLATTVLAFAGNDAPARLVLAGADCGERFREAKSRHPTMDFSGVTVLDGPQSDEAKTLLHSAADYVVLSYRRGRDRDSGTLADATGFGLPVCCSDGGAAGELVRSYRLGLVFAAENPDALRACANGMSSFALNERDRLQFMSDWSVEGISRRLVAAAAQPDLDS